MGIFAFYVLTLAASDLVTTRVKIVVPVLPAEIGRVTVDGRAVPIHAITSSSETPVILVYFPPFENEYPFFQELRAFFSFIEPAVPTEVWSSLGTGRNELSAQFQMGLIGAIGLGPTYAAASRAVDHAQLIDLLARRFIRTGPVRVFVLDTFFQLKFPFYLPLLKQRGFDQTAIEPQWNLIGDAGLMVYPVLLKGSPGRHAKLHRSDSAAIFGNKEIIVGGEVGTTLADAYNESAKGSVITVDVPVSVTLRSAPLLQVYSKENRKVFERLVPTGGAAAKANAEPALAEAELRRSFCRIVPFLPVKKVDVTLTCNGLRPDLPTNRFIRIIDAKFPARQPYTAKVLISTTRRGRESTALPTRGLETTLRRQGPNGACIGPVSVPQESYVYIHQPGQISWLTAIQVKAFPASWQPQR